MRALRCSSVTTGAWLAVERVPNTLRSSQRTRQTPGERQGRVAALPQAADTSPNGLQTKVNRRQPVELQGLGAGLTAERVRIIDNSGVWGRAGLRGAD